MILSSIKLLKVWTEDGMYICFIKESVKTRTSDIRHGLFVTKNRFRE